MTDHKLLTRINLGKIQVFIAVTIISTLLILFLYRSSDRALVPLDDPNSCRFAREFVGPYETAINGTGLEDTNPGTFDVFVPGRPIEAYLYWNIRYQFGDSNIRLSINNSSNIDINADETFGPAALGFNQTLRYWGYIENLQSYINSGLITQGSNRFSLSKPNPPADSEIFGGGVIIIYEDTSLPTKHVEIKCGLDVVYPNFQTDSETGAQWGQWSDVVCHQFPASVQSREVEYNAFMSGTKKKTEECRPNAFYYKSGDGNGSIPSSILNLGPDSQTGLNTISGHVRQDYVFEANRGNEWDTFDYRLNIPAGHDYICFQVEAYNDFDGCAAKGFTEELNSANGKGTSMQWALSTVVFDYAGTNFTPPPTIPQSSPTPLPTGPGGTPAPTNPPGATTSPGTTIIPGTTATPVPSPTATPLPTPTPTPIIYYPWVGTNNGDTYSYGFDQMTLGKVNDTNNNQIAYSYLADGSEAPFNGDTATLSTYLYLQNSPNQVPFNGSLKEYETNNYQDDNATYDENTTWYDYLSGELTVNLLTTTIVTNPSIGAGITRISQIGGIPADHLASEPLVIVFDAINGNPPILDLSQINICDRKAIIIVEGSLILDPEFITEGFTNGCMFVVEGGTTIKPGNDLGSNDAAPATYYDRVEAFIITDSFATLSDPAGDGFYLRGGLITNTIDLKRDLGTIRNRYSPAEIIQFDPRFLYIYDDLLRYIFPFQVRESQFIRLLNQ